MIDLIDLLTVFVVIAVFLFGIFMWSLCRIAAKPTPQVPKPQTCTRHALRVCTVNGPCNGFPRLPINYFDIMKDGSLAYAYCVDLTAEGRPTMPSEVESELEMGRRTR